MIDPKDFAFGGGATYDAALDFGRLSNNLQRVYHLMMDGQWHTVDSLAQVGGLTWSRRVRDLRGTVWGPMLVNSERIKGGLWKYRIDLTTWTHEIHHKITHLKPTPRGKSNALKLPPEGSTTTGRAEKLLGALCSPEPPSDPEAIAMIERHFRVEQEFGAAHHAAGIEWKRRGPPRSPKAQQAT